MTQPFDPSLTGPIHLVQNPVVAEATDATPTVADHLEKVLAAVGPLRPISLTLDDAHGCVLAEDVIAQTALPATDLAALDGYAVRVSDLATASPSSPVVLPVVADVDPLSTSPVSVQPGFCVRITTGSPMPAGADAVVPTGFTDGGIASVGITESVEAGAWIRRAGTDVAAGSVVLPAQVFLGAPQVALLASIGRDAVLAHPRPRVVVVSVGAGLTAAGSRLAPGDAYDATSHALTAAAREAGAIAYRVGVVPADPRRLLDTLEDHLIRADVLIACGGADETVSSVLRDVLSRLGTVEYTTVAVHPGPEQGFGAIGPDAIPFFGLPGSPVAALISFEVFVRPVLRRMLAAAAIHRPSLSGALQRDITSIPGSVEYLPVLIERRAAGGVVVTPLRPDGATSLATLSAANGLAVLPESVATMKAGADVEVVLLERRGR